MSGFWMDEHPVTNLEFTRFVKETGHATWAVQAPDPAQYPDAKEDLLSGRLRGHVAVQEQLEAAIGGGR